MAQRLARLSMDAQGIAGDSPETAAMMREIQNQVRMATMKIIQQKQQTRRMAPANIDEENYDSERISSGGRSEHGRDCGYCWQREAWAKAMTKALGPGR